MAKEMVLEVRCMAILSDVEVDGQNDPIVDDLRLSAPDACPADHGLRLHRLVAKRMPTMEIPVTEALRLSRDSCRSTEPMVSWTIIGGAAHRDPFPFEGCCPDHSSSQN